MSILQELKRRHVLRVGIAYAITAWLVLQVGDVLSGNLNLPPWAFKLVFLLLVLGFPIVMVLAWVYDWTPKGVVRTDTSDGETAPSEAPPQIVTALPAEASVAVLPFVNMSGDPENEYFSDGLSEELLNVLAKNPSLKVAARTSSFHFKGQTGNIAEIARTLSVAAVLEGSVRQSGKRVRITAQLINANDGYHLWTETYDRELDDIFAVQDEIATSVSKALQIKLLGAEEPEAAGGTSNTEAFQHYLLGVHHRNQGHIEEPIRRAIDAFQRAVDLDPGYAKAWAGLALAWGTLVGNGFVPSREGVPKMEAAIERALELAPELADGWMALEYKLASHTGDQAGALKASSTALELNPGNAEVQIEYARINCNIGNHDASVAAAKKALELDPISVSANHALGHVLYFARRFDEAIAAERQALHLDPHYPKPHYFIAMSLYWLGDTEGAWHEIQLEPLAWMRTVGSAAILHRLGRIEEAETVFAPFVAAGEEQNNFIQQADVYAQWGDTEEAIRCLHRAFDLEDPGLGQMLVDPFLDPLRGDPRFIDLLERFGFGEARATH